MRKRGKPTARRQKLRRAHQKKRKEFLDKEQARRRREKREGEHRLDYEERGVRLKQMGYGSYKKYLESPLWREIRERVLARDKWMCRLCGSGAVQVHHRSYAMAVLKGEDLEPLAAVCVDCHRKIERKPDGEKRNRHEVARLFLARLRDGNEGCYTD